MLKALLHGKSRVRREGDGPGTVLDDYRDGEDPLTSFVFGTLLYLPSESLWRLLREATGPNGSLPAAPGELSLTMFWPSWWLTSADGRRRRVEPDVFLSCEACDVIVEAKRYDGQQMQYAAQLARELAAHFQTRPTGRPVYLLAVGGLLNIDSQAATLLRQEVADELTSFLGQPLASELSARIELLSWARMLRAVRAMLETDSLSRQHTAILDDVAAALELHHVVDWRPTWLSDLSSSISKHQLGTTTHWTQLRWRDTTTSLLRREKSSVHWWREAAAYRPSGDHAQQVLERLTGAW